MSFILQEITWCYNSYTPEFVQNQGLEFVIYAQIFSAFLLWLLKCTFIRTGFQNSHNIQSLVYLYQRFSAVQEKIRHGIAER